MSDKNQGLNFYVMHGPDDSYCLFNAMTDKDILFAEERQDIENFLMMNCPDHPFLFHSEASYDTFTFDTDAWAGIESDSSGLLDPYFKSSVFDTKSKRTDYTLISETLKDLNSDYAYYDPFLTKKDKSQLSFSFMDRFKSKVESEEEVTEDDVPFLPEDE